MPLRSINSALRERLPYLVLVAFVLILDQVTKSAVHQGFDLGESYTVIVGFFDLTYVRNTGVAFGLFSSVGSSAKAALLSAFAALAAIVVVIYSVRNPAGHHLLQAALALILGGALGNLFDRVAHGYVIDFFYFHIGEYYWPAFNIADAAISLGVVFLAAEIIQDEVRARA